jgi:hypothetical protein
VTVRHVFEPDRGYRFTKGQVSLLLHAAARFRQTAAVTDVDLFNSFKCINKFLINVGAYEDERLVTSAPMSADHFSDLNNAVFYKFLPERSLQYYVDGSFQFGSIQDHRTIEQQNSKDSMEGLCNIAVKTPKHLFGMSLASGYNFGIFCGTSTLNRRDEMTKRFGPRIIKIVHLKEFAEEAKQLLTPQRFYFNLVVYNDLKMFRTNTLKSIRLSRDEPPGNFDPNLIDDRVFDLLYDKSFLPSLFMKPTRFSMEEELRLVFEMPQDVPDVLRITDASLLKHIEIIH